MKNLAQKIIAVTGGIGSGKSSVLQILNDNGYPVFSCDEIVNNLYKDRKIKLQLKVLFPTAVKGEKRLTVDKKTLSKLCFESLENRKKLENFTHPLILKKAIGKIKKTKAPLCFLEVPLLFEGGYESLFDGVLVIVRDKKLRIESVKTRSNLTEMEILDRINAQIDYDKLNLSKYLVIVNDGNLDNLKEKTLKLIKNI